MRRIIGCAILGVVALTPTGEGFGQDVREEGAVRVAASAPSAARAPAAPAGTISMDLVSASLDDVLKLLSQHAGMNFVASESARDRRVTVYLDQVPVQTAIRSILDANNLSFRQIPGSNVYVVGDSGGRAVKLTTKVYTLKYARVVPTLGETTATFGDSGSILRPTFTGTGTGGEGSSSGGSSSNSSGSRSSSGGTGSGGAQTHGIVAIIKQLLTERGSVTTDPRTNSLAVTDVDETFPLVEETIAKLDVRPAQVYLEAEVLEVKRSTLHRLGIEYGSSAGSFATFTGPSRQTDFPLGPTLLKRASTPTHTLGTLALTNITATLKALETESDVRFLASPRLMTLSNEVAEIRIITDAATGTTSFAQTDTGTITTQAERTTVGTVLRVTPLVTGDRYITMVIEPEVSRVVASTTFSSFLDPDRRSARTTILVEDGETAMIAGLLSQDRDLGDRKVPWLSKIPLLGAAFSRAEHTITDSEIVIFITPHIVKESRAAVPQGLPSVAGLVPTIPVREQSTASVDARVAERHRRALKSR